MLIDKALLVLVSDLWRVEQIAFLDALRHPAHDGALWADVLEIAGDKSLDNVRVIERGGEISLSGVRADQLGPLGALLSALAKTKS
ncbi:MAG: hypothetical protein JNK05_32920 [Myxococcales bacterium]|nr:hypothetical protein [Myxococcales bacterium]